MAALVYLLNDDHIALEDLSQTVTECFPEASLVTDATEHAFLRRLARWIDGSEPIPHVFLLDTRVRWTDPAPAMPPPPPGWKEDNGFWRAGVRCAFALKGNRKTRGFPVAIVGYVSFSEAIDHVGPAVPLAECEIPLNPMFVPYVEIDLKHANVVAFLRLARPAP